MFVINELLCKNSHICIRTQKLGKPKFIVMVAKQHNKHTCSIDKVFLLHYQYTEISNYTLHKSDIFTVVLFSVKITGI